MCTMCTIVMINNNNNNKNNNNNDNVMYISGDVSDAMRAVAQLAAESFIPDTDNGSQHVINHFNIN